MLEDEKKNVPVKCDLKVLKVWMLFLLQVQTDIEFQSFGTWHIMFLFSKFDLALGIWDLKFLLPQTLSFNENCPVIVLRASLFATLHIKHADTSVFCFSKFRILCCLNNGSAGCLFFLKDIFLIASFNLLCIGFRLLAVGPPQIRRPETIVNASLYKWEK